jgi:hypothetical protein
MAGRPFGLCVAALGIAVESATKDFQVMQSEKLHRCMDGGGSGWVVKELLPRGTKAS